MVPVPTPLQSFATKHLPGSVAKTLFDDGKGPPASIRTSARIADPPAPNVVGVNYMWIPIGLIENPNSTIVVHLWHSSKAIWNQYIAHARLYEGMPEGLEAFVAFSHVE